MATPFPDWGSTRDRTEIQRQMAACERVLRVALDISERPIPLRQTVGGSADQGTPIMPRAVFQEFGRATKSFRACLHVASGGYGQAANAIAMVVAESSLIVHWANERGEAVDHLAELHSRYRWQLEIEEREAAGYTDPPPDVPPLTKGDRTEAEEKFGPTASGLWTGHTSVWSLIDDLSAAEADPFTREMIARLKVEMTTAHAMGSSTGLALFSHGLLRETEGGDSGIFVNLGPGAEGVGSALHLAGWAFLSAVNAVVDGYFPDLEQEVRAAQALLWRAWRDPSVLADLADDAPCPCTKPGVTWASCHKWTESLGTVAYVPYTDADLVHFTPYDPTRKPPAIDEARLAQQPSDLPIGPHIQTFTFTLPFTLGLEDTVGHAMTVGDDWVDPNDIAHFGKVPTVRIVLHNERVPWRGFWLGKPSEVLQRLYGARADEPIDVDVSSIEDTYEQWVSLETPGARLRSESPTDPAFAFHRSLTALDSFLRAMDLAVSDPRVTTVTTHDLGAIVFRGAYTTDGRWTRLGDLLMHPNAYPFPLSPVPFEDIKAQFIGCFTDLTNGRPFSLANLWHSRAQRAFDYRGDLADCIVSLQTAVESMMYDLARSLLVDERETAAEITAKLAPDIPFKSLLTKVISPRLGGNWQLAGNGAVARYWSSLYMLRNRVVHAGYSPGVRETEDAKESFTEIREFVSVRLWERWPRYPRTLLAKVGTNGLERRGWMTRRVRDACVRLIAEPNPFYWPRDVAGR